MQVGADWETMLRPIFNIWPIINLRKTGKLPRILSRGEEVVPLLHLYFEKVILATMWKNGLPVVKKINRRVLLGDIFNGIKQQNSEVKNMEYR